MSTRLLSTLARLLPGDDRVWGEALLAELDHVPPRLRFRWMLGVLPLIAARLRRAPRSDVLRVGACAGLVSGAVLSADIAYTNLGPGSSHPGSDPLAPTLAAYAAVFLMLVVVGFVIRGRGRPLAASAGAAAVSAVVILAVVAVTTVVVDNVWLPVVARQPDKISGLAHSLLFHNMRAYLNAHIVLGLIFSLPFGAALAALCGTAGALVRRRGEVPS